MTIQIHIVPPYKIYHPPLTRHSISSHNIIMSRQALVMPMMARIQPWRKWGLPFWSQSSCTPRNSRLEIKSNARRKVSIGVVDRCSWFRFPRTGEIIPTASACGKSFPALLATKQRFQPTRPGIIRQIYQNIAAYSNFLLYSHIFHYISLYFTIFGYILPCLPPFWVHLQENIAKYSAI